MSETVCGQETSHAPGTWHLDIVIDMRLRGPVLTLRAGCCFNFHFGRGEGDPSPLAPIAPCPEPPHSPSPLALDHVKLSGSGNFFFVWAKFRCTFSRVLWSFHTYPGLRNTHFRNVTVHLSPKWADLGKMRENGEKCGKFRMLDGKVGNLGAEKVKKHGSDWQQG